MYIVATINYFYNEYIAEESHLKDVEFLIKKAEMVHALKKKEGIIFITQQQYWIFSIKSNLLPCRGD